MYNIKYSYSNIINIYKIYVSEWILKELGNLLIHILKGTKIYLEYNIN
jgi:ribosomal silencing factor RsfS